MKVFLKVSPVVLLLLLLGYGWFATRIPGTDSEQIQKAIQDSIRESKNGEPGSATALLADGFTVNHQDTNAATIARLIRKYNPEITFEPFSPTVAGDTAKVETSADLSVSQLGVNMDFKIKKVSLFLRKIPEHAWLIYPRARWRLTAVTVSEQALTDAISDAAIPGF